MSKQEHQHKRKFSLIDDDDDDDSDLFDEKLKAKHYKQSDLTEFVTEILFILLQLPTLNPIAQWIKFLKNALKVPVQSSFLFHSIP